MILLFLQLILAHIIGDFVLQPQKWVEDKEKNKQKSPYLYWHILIHTITLVVILQFSIKYWLGIVIIVFSHFFIDLIKLHLINKVSLRWLFLLDQIAHLLIIAGVVNMYEYYVISIEAIYLPKNLLLIIAVLLVTVVTSILMKVIITKWELEENSENNSLKDAGKYIGVLERLFIFVFIVSNNWQAIGFLLAAKSIFRFGDLSKSKGRKLTEYVLIGTLLSFGFAILIGFGYMYFLNLLA